MKVLSLIVAAFLFIVTSGCNVSKPYVMKMDRVDQKLNEGNRGYIKGTPPPSPDRNNLKRPFIAVDIDLPDVHMTDSKSSSYEAANKAPAVKEQAVVKEKNMNRAGIK